MGKPQEFADVATHGDGVFFAEIEQFGLNDVPYRGPPALGKEDRSCTIRSIT